MERREREEKERVIGLEILRLLAVVGEVGFKVFPELLYLHRTPKAWLLILTDESDSIPDQSDTVLD